MVGFLLGAWEVHLETFPHPVSCLHSTWGHMESLRTEHILDKLPSHCAQFFNCVQLCVTPWTVAPQTPLSMEFSRQEYYISYSRDLPNPGIHPISLESPALAGRFLTTPPPGKLPLAIHTRCVRQCQRIFKLLHNCIHLTV